MPIVEGGIMAGGSTSVLRATTEQRASSRDSGSTIFSRNAPSSVQTSHSTDLMRGLNALRRAEKLFDVSLIVEGKTFKAHRVVLAACSDYFCAMFTDAMREARQTEIKLNGVNARGIELLIEYAYTSKLELDRSNVQDVLSVSTHVQMNSVIEACSNYLESQIDLENCVAIATLADLYALDTLKRKTYRYMCSRLAEFAQTPDLHNLSWEQVEHVLSCNYPVDCTESNVLKIIFKYCLHSKLSAEYARCLMEKIRFNDIGVMALDGILDKIAAAASKSNDADGELEVYSELARQECAKQDRERQTFIANTSGSDQQLAASDDAITVDILTNSRGMELALVKIGGFETNGLTNQISCFLPSKGKWENLTVIPHIDQCNYGTAVLGNDLYVVGGSYDVCLKEYTHPFGFRYCPTKDKWNSIAPIQADRCRFSLSAMGTNYLYAVGGVCELNDNDDVSGGVGGVGVAGRIEGQVGAGEQWAYDMPVSNFERYDAKADRWEYLPTLTENRSQHAGLVIGDNLYISGGIDRHMVLATLWRFSTSTFKWQKLSAMPTPRADHTLIAFDGHIYACGGWYEDLTTETRVLAETIDVYDVAKNVWSTETINPMPKFYTGVAAVKRKIYFIGGLLSSTTFNRATSAVQCYDLDTKEWSFNSEWEYPNEVWECSCAAFYVPTERNDMLYFCADDAARN